MPNTSGAPPLAGALGAFALTDVLQLLDLGARTGVVDVDGGPRGRGTITMSHGRILEVEVAPAASVTVDTVDRLALLMALDAGHWAFYPRSAPFDDGGVVGSGVRVVDVLLEASCRQDQRATQDRHAPEQAHPASELPTEAGVDKLTGAELAVLAAIDGSRGVQAIATVLRRDRAHVRTALDRLHALGLVHPDDIGATT